MFVSSIPLLSPYILRTTQPMIQTNVCTCKQGMQMCLCTTVDRYDRRCVRVAIVASFAHFIRRVFFHALRSPHVGLPLTATRVGCSGARPRTFIFFLWKQTAPIPSWTSRSFQLPTGTLTCIQNSQIFLSLQGDMARLEGTESEENGGIMRTVRSPDRPLCAPDSFPTSIFPTIVGASEIISPSRGSQTHLLTKVHQKKAKLKKNKGKKLKVVKANSAKSSNPKSNMWLKKKKWSLLVCVHNSVWSNHEPFPPPFNLDAVVYDRYFFSFPSLSVCLGPLISFVCVLVCAQVLPTQ